MKENNYNSLQAGRGLAALAVLLFHANATLALPKYLGSQPAPVFRAGDSGVAFFFVLSGTVMLLAHRSEFGRGYKAALEFAWKRVRRIYPPLWVALTFVFCALLFAPSLSIVGFPDTLDIFSSYLATPSSIEPLLIVEWTLRHEVIFYLLFGLALVKLRVGIVSLSVWFGFAFVGAFLPVWPLKEFLAGPVNLLFAFGLGVALIVHSSTVKHPILLLFLGSSVFALTWCSVVIGMVDHNSPGTIWTYGLGAATALIGAMALERSGKLQPPAWLVSLGAASYSIYLVHFPIVSACAKIFAVLDKRIGIYPIFWFAATCVIALSGGCLFYLAVEKPLYNTLKNLPIGQKFLYSR